MEEQILTVYEIPFRKLSHALDDSCAFELVFLGNTYETLVSNVLRNKRIFPTRNIWIPSEFYCLQAASVDLCICFASQKLLWALIGPPGNSRLIKWLLGIRLVQKKEFTAMSRAKTIS